MSDTTAIAAAVVETHDVTREYRVGAVTVHALRSIDLFLSTGEFVALRGRSGSGKTTLLNILVGLDDPTQGRVMTLGHDLAQLNEAKRAALRRESIGLLFQNAHLFPTLTAQENVEVALRLQLIPQNERVERARTALELVGLGARAHHRGLELSGGEQQRVALARALVHTPRLVIADEPTGNLDSQTARKIVQLFQDIVRQTGITLLIATHDATVYNTADRILHISDGRIV
ncbi:MAG TPA: ABC transporter ATP-binding protein [Ktedonobacteraceae bacterium]